MRQPEPLSVEEMTEMQALQLKRYLLDLEDQAFSRKLAESRQLDLAGYGKTWAINGLTVVFLKDELTGQERKASGAAASAAFE